MTATAIRQMKVEENEIKHRVQKALEEYKVLRVRMENRKELEQSGMTSPFGTLSDSKEDQIKFKLLDRAFREALTEDEREIIEMKFLSSNRIKDITLWTELGISKKLYYSFKNPALRKLAKALSIC